MSFTILNKLWPYASDLITAINFDFFCNLFLIVFIFFLKIFASINISDFKDVIHLKNHKNHH